MADLQDHSFRASLVEAIGALGKAVRGMDAGSAQAVTAARALAQELRVSGTQYGYPQITAAAAPIPDAPANIVPRLVTRLVRITEEVASSGWDEKTNILVVEGFSKIGAALREKLCAPNREVLVTRTAASATEMVGKHEIALVVLDLVLPDMDGRNLLSRLREDPRTQAIPVVVLASAGGHELQSECFALGADQYFETSSDVDMLSVAIASTLHRSLQSVRDTHRDALTSLLNRDGLRRKLRRTLAKASRKRCDVSFGILSLEPSYVDSEDTTTLSNYSAMVISQVGRAIGEVLRPKDTVARWRELELAILFNETDREGAKKAIERVRTALNAELFTLAGKRYRVEFSSGVVQLQGPMPLEEVVAEADRVLLAQRQKRETDERYPLSRPKPRILIIDHENEVAFALSRRLGEDGFEVRHVRDRDSAILAIMAGRTALILLEAKLPEGQSFPLLAELRATPEIDRVPIVMMTIMGRDLDVARAFESGADDYVMKPCSTPELLARIRRHLKRTKQLSAPIAPPGRAGSIAGLFTGDQLYEFVQMLGLNAKSGRLLLSGNALSGHVDFRGGKVVGAWTSEGEEALKATHTLLALDAGKFEFWPGEAPSDEQGILANVDNLLLDVMRMRDESGRGA